ncbi:hypothetical protein N1E91_11775 [Pseudomonas aeruginosa]|jgi:hypothetical protein|nr:hypothetical protein [Pseudomonas aeruginosa]MCS9139124.1 hypothetical protein [Pseudomonas aeruginosa]MCS9211895.1 hypothetical protein [Pseudomonas aeruginosa]
MGKRKVFAETDLSIPQVNHCRDASGNVDILPDHTHHMNTKVEFGRNATPVRSFDFARWYGTGIDTITYACQIQIERFLAGQDAVVTIATVTAYCSNGLCSFLDYCMLQATALDRDLVLADVNRDLIDGFLSYLAWKGLNAGGQRSIYTHAKSVLVALGRRKLFPLVSFGDASTFPRNPFPNQNRKTKGETALSMRARKALTLALRQATKPIWDDNATVTGELLAYALLAIALHTGRNTTPLLEMDRNCLRPHPRENTAFLVLWKRRGYNTSKVALHAESTGKRIQEFAPSVRANIERLIRRVMALTQPLDTEAPKDLKGRVWLYHSRAYKSFGQVTALSDRALSAATRNLVTNYGLTDDDGEPLRLNISRLRKTFANRIFDLTDGDLIATAAALGNTTQVADQNYLAPDENARRNWRFMGEVLVEELLSRTIGATYKGTPMGHCADPIHGQYAPKRDDATCMNFINCLRCKHYAVTAEDLYKVFSFYFRILAERSRIERRRWAREFAHIPRLIDHYIVAEGIRRGIFKTAVVEAARERARTTPHPFWSVDVLDDLEVFT